MQKLIIACLALTTGCIAATDQTGTASQAVTGGNACDGVQLDASRQYRPRSWTDANLTLAAGSLTFAVPTSIPVVAGNAGHGKVKFAFSLAGDVPTICSYRGSGGTSFDFVACRAARISHPDADDDDDDADHDDGPPVATVTAGSVVTADWFYLHVNRGDRHAGITSVSVHLGGPVITDNDACTIDACADGTITHTPIPLDDGDACTADACDAVLGPTHTLIDTPFCRGQADFNDGELVGLGANGRACSSCHVESQAWALTPANAEARFQAMVTSGVDDPLFRALDADDFRVNGAAAIDFTNLRQRGLVRVSIPLPPNVRLLDCGSLVPCPASAQPTAETVADVWRAVPSVFNVAITGPDTSTPIWPRGPNTRGGYQLDGRIDTLQNQATSALQNHAQVAMLPPGTFLDDVAAFEQAQLTAPEPATLTPLQAQGKAIFIRACAAVCHGGAGTSTPVGAPNRYIDIGTTYPRPVDTVSPPRFVFDPASQLAGNVRTYEFTLADGFKVRKTTSDPGRALLTGYVVSAPAPVAPAVCAHPPCGAASSDDFQKFDMPPMFGIAHTAPYFHNNSAATLDDVLNHYDAFFARTKITTPLSPSLSTNEPGSTTPLWDRPVKRVDEDGGAERAALLAYLAVL